MHCLHPTSTRTDARFPIPALFGSPLAEPGQNLADIGLRKDEAAVAAAKPALPRDDIGADIPGGMDHDRAGFRVAVGRIEAEQAPRRTVIALIRSEEHTSELQSLMRISYAVFCLKKKNTHTKL